MRARKTLIVFTLIFSVATLGASPSIAQQPLTAPSFSIATPDETAHALTSTRFHFITLKEFQSALFEFEGEQEMVDSGEARLINTGLNAFLTSPSRATVLLEALRKEKAVQLKFALEKQTDHYRMVKHPRKGLLYRIQPITEKVPVEIKIRPLLDGPVAFEINVSKDGEAHSYDVDWAGQVIR